jgi:DNA-binding GntR family transcriptional regulator
MVPKYREIIRYLEEAILKGELEPGKKIPSENELARLFNTTRMTVRRALKELEISGIIRRVPGIGTFVCDKNILSDKTVGIAVNNKHIVYGVTSYLSDNGIEYFILNYEGGLENEKKQ